MWPFCDRCCCRCCCCCCRCLSPMLLLLLLFRFYLVAYCFCDFYLSVWFISVACFAIKNKKKGKTKNKRESLLWSQRVNSARMSNSNNNSGKFYANVAFPMLGFCCRLSHSVPACGLCELWHHKTAATRTEQRDTQWDTVGQQDSGSHCRPSHGVACHLPATI